MTACWLHPRKHAFFWRQARTEASTICPVPAPGPYLMVVSVQVPDSGTPFQELPTVEESAEDSLATVLEETRKLPGPTRGRGRTSIAELLADERSQAVLQFFATTDVGRTSGPPVAEDGEYAASEASEWEARDQAERAWERREEERLGAE